MPAKRQAKDKAPIKIRQAEPDDINFIYATWLKSYRASRLARSIDADTYYSGEHYLIDKLLADASVLVASDVDDGKHIYGYLVFERTSDKNIVHYVYTKMVYRSMGIASEMLKVAIDTTLATEYSHETDDGIDIMKRFKATYNPNHGLGDTEDGISES